MAFPQPVAPAELRGKRKECRVLTRICMLRMLCMLRTNLATFSYSRNPSACHDTAPPGTAQVPYRISSSGPSGIRRGLLPRKRAREGAIVRRKHFSLESLRNSRGFIIHPSRRSTPQPATRPRHRVTKPGGAMVRTSRLAICIGRNG